MFVLPTTRMELLNDADETETSQQVDSTEDAAGMAADPVAIGAAASVLFSWYLFYLKGNKVQGLFVGLWAPTMLGAASYLKQLKLAEKLDKGLRFQ